MKNENTDKQALLSAILYLIDNGITPLELRAIILESLDDE